MARLSYANEGEELDGEELKDFAITQVVEHKWTVRPTYGRRSRKLSMQVEMRPDIYDVPQSPPKKSQPRRSLMADLWSSIYKGPSNTDDFGTLPNRLQRSLLMNSPTSSTPGPRLLLTSGLESSSNAIPSHSTSDIALHSNTSPVRSDIQAAPQPCTAPGTAPIQSNSHKSIAGETAEQDEYSPRHIKSQCGAEASAVPKLKDQVHPAIAADSSNTDPTRDVEMSEIDGEEDITEEKHSGNHNRDDNAEFFEIEALKACKLNPGGRVLLEVKWKDYEGPSGLTWEPEAKLRKDVPHIVDKYFEKRGGRVKVLQYLRDERAKEKANLRRKGTARVKGSGISKRRV